MNSDHSYWDICRWLRAIATGSSNVAPGELADVWHRHLTSGNRLLAECQKLRQDPDLRYLKEAYKNATAESDAGEPKVLAFLRKSYRDFYPDHAEALDAARYYHALVGFLSAAIAEHRATQTDPLEQDEWLRKTRKSCQRAFGSANGPARDLAAVFQGGERRVQRDRTVPVLGAMSGHGFVNGLCLELIKKKGTAEFYPHLCMSFKPRTSAFSTAVHAAWEVGCRFARSRKWYQPSGDVRWHLTETQLPVLDGGSLGAALAIAVIMLLNKIPNDPRVALAAEVQEDFSLGQVDQIGAKINAALSHPQRKIRWVIVHPRDYQEALAAAKAVLLDAGRAVKAIQPALTVAEALELMRERPWPLLAGIGAVGAVLLACSLAYMVGRPGQGASGGAPAHPSSKEPEPVAPPQVTNNAGKRASASQKLFSVDRFYVPSGVIGNIDDVAVIPKEDNIVRFRYIASGKGKPEWDLKFLPTGEPNPERPRFSGVCYQSPSGNWGDLDGGWDFREFKPRKVSWQARRVSPAPFVVEFFMGSDGWVWKEDGIGRAGKTSPKFRETMPRTVLWRDALQETWQHLEAVVHFDRDNEDNLRRVLCGFGWMIYPEQLDGKSYEFEVKDIRYERGSP
jgi:hypothetical protein